MPLPNQPRIAEAIRLDVDDSRAAAKRLRIRSLLRKFGYVKRSDSNTADITQCLSEQGVAINPPILRLGGDWELSVDDWVYLSTGEGGAESGGDADQNGLPADWNADGWFDRLDQKELRTE